MSDDLDALLGRADICPNNSVHPSMRCPECSSKNVAVRNDGHGAAQHVNPDNNGLWSSAM